MKQIDHNDIVQLNISPTVCVDWVKEAFSIKDNSYLPPKYSLKLNEDVFINTMPSYIPASNVFGVKIVTRYPHNVPSLDSIIMLFNSLTGEQIAVIDGNWITAMRTGGVAALSINALQKTNSSVYALLGLGNTARATLLCLLELNSKRKYYVKLLKYKDQAEEFMERFKLFDNVQFEIVDTERELIKDSDVIVSCITSAKKIIGDDSWFKKGVLVVPVHTRGFQNCDLFFDKVFADDKGHVENFKYFKQFKYFSEFQNVLKHKNIGRANEDERILIYNIGIALHDIFFASKIYNLVGDSKELKMSKPHRKHWI